MALLPVSVLAQTSGMMMGPAPLAGQQPTGIQAPAAVMVQPAPVVVQPPAMVVQPAPVAVPVVPAAAIDGNSQFTQSPAYKECTALAGSNPIAAEAKAAEWLQVDQGIGAHHCRAMAFYGQRRFAEAAQELSTVRSKIAPASVELRTHVARQTSKAWMDAGRPDAAITALGEQISDMSVVQGNNAAVSTLTSSLLLERAKLRLTYGQAREAVQDLDHAVTLTPTDEQVLMERAHAFAQLGDIALAKNDVASVLKLNPANSKAQELRRLLNNPTGK